jgi:hypothetical protein
MPKYVIDASVIDQINQGHYALAHVVGTLLESRAEVWMTSEDYHKVTTPDRSWRLGPPTRVSDGSLQISVRSDRLQELRNAVAEFIRAVGIRYPMNDNYFKQYERKPWMGNFRGTHMRTAALAFDLNAEVITMDSEFLTAWRQIEGRVVPQAASLTPVSGEVDFNRARRFFNLRPVVLAGDRIVPPQLVYKIREPDKAVIRVIPPPDGPRTNGGTRKTVTPTKRVGMPLTAPKEYGPSARGEAGMQGGIFVLQGLNLLFKYLNGKDNKERFEADWKRIAPGITSTLNADPSLGALVLVNYSKVGTPGDGSVIEAAVRYTFTQVSYGRTLFEARQNIPPRYEARPAGSTAEEQWVPPQQPLDITKLPTPFPSLALATFVTGKAKFINVGYKYRGGFYEHRGSADVNVSADPSSRPQFLLLRPPEVIQCFYFGSWQGRETDIFVLPAAEYETGWNHRVGLFGGCPVVELDSSTYAGMVYPANKATERLFESVPVTNDKEHLLARYDMKLIRWVEPQNVRLLDVFPDLG